MYRLFASMTLLLITLAVFTPVAAASPTLSIVSPTDGGAIKGNTVTVEFKTADLKIVSSMIPLSDYGKRPDANVTGEGHLHFTLDLWPLVVWEKATPYTFNNVPAGEHMLTVELVNNDHSSFSPPITQVIHFQTAATAAMPGRLPVTGAAESPAAMLGALALTLLAAGAVVRRRAV